MAIQESGEMYLESILVLIREKGRARSVDVAEYLGFSKPSVSQAVKNLKDEGYISVEAGGNLVLTEKGTELAEKVYERHVIITDTLVSIGVSRETAAKDACRIEHVISDETFRQIKKHTAENRNDT